MPIRGQQKAVLWLRSATRARQRHQLCRRPSHRRAKPSAIRMSPNERPSRCRSRSLRPYLSVSVSALPYNFEGSRIYEFEHPHRRAHPQRPLGLALEPVRLGCVDALYPDDDAVVMNRVAVDHAISPVWLTAQREPGRIDRGVDPGKWRSRAHDRRHKETAIAPSARRRNLGQLNRERRVRRRPDFQPEAFDVGPHRGRDPGVHRAVIVSERMSNSSRHPLNSRLAVCPFNGAPGRAGRGVHRGAGFGMGVRPGPRSPRRERARTGSPRRSARNRRGNAPSI